jgi:hypothetical protein
MFGDDSWLANGRSWLKKYILWLAIATVIEHPGWLKKVDGEIFIWLAEQ